MQQRRGSNPPQQPHSPASERKQSPPEALGQDIIRWEQTMNWDRIEGNWKQFKGKVQQQWGKLTDDDLDVIKGNQTELAGRLQQRYGYAKDEAQRHIDTWMKTVN
jgi:uncharacterized protein YjbJ (UPF0337 family)